MLHDINKYSEKLKAFILKAYSLGYSVDAIASVTNLKKNIVLTLLDNEGIKFKNKELPSFSTTGDKILVVADTHIGSEFENFGYIDEAYEFGLKENVSSCIHLGDLVQGMYDKTAYGLDMQMKMIEDKYPELDEFNTYLLMGNHDYGVFNDSPEYQRVIKNKKGLVDLGYKKIYFDWNGQLLSMEHKLKRTGIFIPEYDNLLTLVGHGHELKQKSNLRVKTPTLSDDIMNHSVGQEPGFIILEMDDEYVHVDAYSFDDNKKVKVKKKNFYKRKKEIRYETK